VEYARKWKFAVIVLFLVSFTYNAHAGWADDAWKWAKKTLIGASIVGVGAAVYYYWFRKKKETFPPLPAQNKKKETKKEKITSFVESSNVESSKENRKEILFISQFGAFAQEKQILKKTITIDDAKKLVKRLEIDIQILRDKEKIKNFIQQNKKAIEKIASDLNKIIKNAQDNEKRKIQELKSKLKKFLKMGKNSSKKKT